MRTLLPLCALALCAVAVFVFATAEGPEEAALTSAAPSAADQRAEAEPSAELDSTRGDRDRATPSAEPRAPEPSSAARAEPEASTPTTEGALLRGSLRWSDDGAPVPHLRLVVHGADGVRFALVSGESGELASDVRLAPGRLRFLLLGEAPVPAGFERYPRGLRLLRESFVVPERVEDFDVELVLERPTRRLLAEVRDGFGQPVDEASVSLESVRDAGAGAEHDLWTQSTDAQGIAAFALYELEQTHALGLIAAKEDAQGTQQVSDLHALALPLPPNGDARAVLVLDAAARLLVRTIDEAGAPVPDQWVWLGVGDAPLFAWLPEGDVTDAAGELRFDALPPGTYEVSASPGPGRVGEEVELTRGTEQVLELVIPIGAPRLAVSGVVLDEEGAPLPLALVSVAYGERVGPGETHSARMTDDEGRFEFQAAPCDGLTVLLDGGLQGDEFSPASAEAAFGETGLVFRRTHRHEQRRLHLSIVSARTQEPVERAMVLTVRTPGTEGYEFRAASDGLLSLSVSEHPDVRLLIDAAGHRRKTLSLAELTRSELIEGVYRVGLEEGVLQTIEIHGEPQGAGDDTRLRAAELWEGSRRLGVADEEGRLTLDLPYWPSAPLRVVAAGHAAGEWSPSDGFGEPGPAQLWLEPTR